MVVGRPINDKDAFCAMLDRSDGGRGCSWGEMVWGGDDVGIVIPEEPNQDGDARMAFVFDGDGKFLTVAWPID